MFRNLLTIAAFVLAVASTAADEKKGPTGQAPLFFIVTAVNSDGLVVEPSFKPTKEVDPPKVEYRPAFKGMKATTAKGQKLSGAEVEKRVKPGSVILVNVDESPIDPAYLALLKDDTVILAEVVPPPRGEAAKPAQPSQR